MDRATSINVAATVAVLISAVGFRIAVSRWIATRAWQNPQEGRRWRVRLQIASVLVSALLLIVI